MEQCLIKVDKMRFSQVIQNLIDNAIKYTNQGWVKVSLQKENNSVLITVADSGIGMSKELQQKLFGEFVRDPSIKKEIRGTGLGLYIAKYIVETHQGKIWAESEGEGKGSKFYVRIPLN
jgi:histidine kinase